MVTIDPEMPRTDADRSSALRLLPSVDHLLRHDDFQSLSRAVLTRVVRGLVDELRQGALDGSIDAAAMKKRRSGGVSSEVTEAAFGQVTEAAFQGF